METSICTKQENITYRQRDVVFNLDLTIVSCGRSVFPQRWLERLSVLFFRSL